MRTTLAGPMTDLLDNPVRPYAWGSLTAIPALLGVPATGAPQAELWLGAHPSAPSRLRREGGRSLLAAIDADPVHELGAEVVAEFGPRLPFLLKVIAAAAPLSLQAHPDAGRAREGYAEENARRVPVDAPDRNYRDQYHKPELLYALTPFPALCGFRLVPETLALLDGLTAAAGREPASAPAAAATEALAPYVAALRARPDGHGLREVVTGLLTLPAPRRTEIIAAVVAACELEGAEGPFEAERRVVGDLGARYPADIGVVISLLLNHIVLRPGQAIFLPAGNLHAYLGGVGVEIMANSDNVLRGGLTGKHIDVAELLRVLDVVAGPPPLVEPAPIGPQQVFAPPVREFLLSRVDLAGTVAVESAGPQILLVVEGAATARDPAGAQVPLARGASLWVPAATPVTLTGRSTVFRATTNLGQWSPGQ